MKRYGKIALSVIATWLVAVLALVGSAAIHFHTDIARRVGARTVELIVNGEIHGRLKIGRFDELGFHHATARYVEMFDPYGNRVISADRVDIIPDAMAALEPRLHFAAGTLTRGFIHLIPSPKDPNIPTFVDMFHPRKPPQYEPPSKNPLRVLVENIKLRDFTLRGSLLGLDGIYVHPLTAVGQIAARGELEVRFKNAAGTLRYPFPFEANFRGASGTFNTNPRKGFELAEARATTPQGDVIAAHISLRQPEDSPDETPVEMRLDIDAAPVMPETIEALGFTWARPFSSAWRGHAGFHLANDVWTIRSAVQTGPAGTAELEGRIDPERVRVEVTARDLDLGEVMDEAPEVRVSGKGSLESQAGPDAAAGIPTFHAELEPLSYDAFVIPSVTLDGTFDETAIEVTRIEARHIGGRITGRGAFGFDGEVRLSLRANVPDAGRDPNIRRTASGMHGTLEGNADIFVSADRQRLEIRTDLRSNGFRYGSLQAQSLHLRGQVRGHPTHPVASIALEGAGLRIENYPLGALTLTLRGGPHHYDAAGLFSREGQRMEFAGTIDTDGRTFSATAPRVEFAIGDAVWGGSVEGLRLVPDREVAFDRIVLAKGSERLEVTGIYRFHGSDPIRGEIQNLDLSLFRTVFRDAFPDVRGSIDCSITLDGDLARPNIAVEGAVRNIAYRDLSDVRGVYLVNYSEGLLSVDTEMSLGEDGTIAVTGTGNIDPRIANPVRALESGTYSFTLDAGGLELELVRRVLPSLPSMQGRASGHLAVQGSLEEPSFSGNFLLDDLALEDSDSFDLRSTVDYAGHDLRGRATLSDAHGEVLDLEAIATVDLVALSKQDADKIASDLENAPWRFALRSPPRVLSSLPKIRGHRFLFPLEVGTSLTASGGGGRPITGDLQASVEWKGLALPGACTTVERPRAQLSATLAQGVTNATVHAMLGQRTIADVVAIAQTPVDAWIHDTTFDSSPEMDVDVRLHDVTAEELPFVCLYGTGPLQAGLDVRGLFGNEPVAHVSLRSDAFTFTNAPPLEIDMNGGVTSENRNFVAEATMRGFEGERANITATMPMNWSDGAPSFNVGAGASINANFVDAPLSPFLRWVPALVNGQGRASGNVGIDLLENDIRMAGEVDIDDGYVEIVGVGQQLTDVRGKILLSGHTLDIDALEAHDGDGTATAQGSVEFREFRPTDWSLSLVARNFPVRREGIVLATLNGNAQLDAQTVESSARGTVKFSNLVIRLPEQSIGSLQPLEPHLDVNVLGLGETVREEADPYPITLHLDATDAFWVRRNDLAARVVADLTAEYRDPNLYVSGYASVRRGFFEVVTKRFDVDRASLNFDGSAQLDPEVDLVAVHQLRDSDDSVTVRVSGRLSQPVVQFTSTNPDATDQGAVIALLMTGRVNVSQAVQPGQERDASQQAANFLAGVLAGVLTLSARREFGNVVQDFGCESGQDAFTTVRCQVGIDAYRLIPKFLRSVVRGAYAQGFYERLSSENAPEGGAAAASNEGGFLLELQWPYNIVSTFTKKFPSGWGLDLTWEP